MKIVAQGLWPSAPGSARRCLTAVNQSLFAQLIRHFFGRFFDNDLLSPQAEIRLTVTHILALLATPGLFITFFLFPKYVYLAFAPPQVQRIAAMGDKFFYIYFTMVVMGFITVLEWDALFPDSRDHAILTPLPIRISAVFAAKIAALIVFLLAFTVVINAIPTLMYPGVSTNKAQSLPMMIRLMGVHGLTMLASTAFVFFFFVGLQGILMTVLSARWFRRVSLAVQFLAMFLLLSLLFLFPKIMNLVQPAMRDGSPFLYLLPPAWFLGMYETLQGWDQPVLQSLADIAWKALAAVIVASLGAYALSYRSYVSGTLATHVSRSPGPGAIESLLTTVANVFIVRHPLERATFYFAAKTLVRSNRHRLFLAAYVGVGFALVLEAVVTMAAGGRFLRLDASSSVLRSIPLVLSFFLLSGMRVIFTIPAELRANWVFPLTGCEHRKECMAGVTKAMIVFGIVPLFAILLPLYVYLWGWSAALLHMAFGVTLSLVLLEILLMNFQKIPFTCSYVPGKAGITTKWALYWFAFFTYAYTMARIETIFTRNDLGIMALFGFVFTILGILIYCRKHLMDEHFTLVFEEEPEPAVLTLDIGMRPMHFRDAHI